VVVALIAAVPPTVAGLLAFAQARSAKRAESAQRSAETARTLEVLGAAIETVQATAERVESGVGDLRERVSRLEGAILGPAKRLRA
jgi:predicted  nucleic acid-binding Zn-ribbon protein